MGGKDRDKILWKLTEIEDPAARQDAPPEESRDSATLLPDLTEDLLSEDLLSEDLLSEDLLEAYRKSRLSATQRRWVEARLVGDPAARQRLQGKAALDEVTVPRDLRQELLDRFGVERREGLGRRRLGALLAASVILVILGGFLLRPEPPPIYDVSISALAQRRDGSEEGGSASAFADSSVKITAVVRERAEGEVQIALYREVGASLERVPEDPRILLRRRPGAVLIRAPAEALVGSRPGSYRLFVVSARGDDLPRKLPRVPAGGDTPTIRRGRRFHPLVLHLLTPTPAVTDPSRTGGRPSYEEEDHETNHRFDPGRRDPGPLDR